MVSRKCLIGAREFPHGNLHFQLHPPGLRAQHLNEILEIDLLEAQLIGEPVGLLGLLAF
jgi:hypothetical protein